MKVPKGREDECQWATRWRGGGWLSDSPHKMGITSLFDDVRKLDVSMADREDGHTRGMVKVECRRGHICSFDVIIECSSHPPLFPDLLAVCPLPRFSALSEAGLGVSPAPQMVREEGREGYIKVSFRYTQHFLPVSTSC